MSRFVLVIVLSVSFLACAADAAIVRMYTILGEIDVELDYSAPLTCANFLRYVNEGAYDNSIFHRSPPGFVLQGGAYKLADPEAGYLVDGIPPYPPVVNEFSPARPNVLGTIAMAQAGTDPNSATSSWFFNVANNSPYLDELNGGFTVFGNVVDGLDVMLALAALDTWNFGDPFADIPTLDTYTQAMYDTYWALYPNGGAYLPTQADLATIYVAVLLADADGDGTVGAADYIALKSNFGSESGATWQQGDFDGDGDVDFDDKAILEFSYGLGPIGTATAAPAGNVPEPATMSLLAAGCVAVVRRRRR